MYLSCFSESNRASGAATPWRMLWFVLVMRKTAGLGFGMYLFYFIFFSRRGKCYQHVIIQSRRMEGGLQRLTRLPGYPGAYRT